MLNFAFTIIGLLIIIEFIHRKEGYGIYFYDMSHNRITDVSNNPLRSSKLFPNVETKSVKQLVSMFSDISYCDNLDDLSYNQTFLKDDLFLYNTYEGFTEIYIEKTYLFMVGLLLIYILFRLARRE
jgi:hypothetical protein